MNEKNNVRLIKKLNPKLNNGRYVFITVNNINEINPAVILCHFKEEEGTTLIMEKELADSKGYPYSFVAAWITLKVYSSLEAVGLTAKVSTALAEECISCNAVAAYHHDHIFVPYRDAERAISILRKLE